MTRHATRRQVLAGVGSAAVGGGALSAPAAAQSGTDLSGWLSNVSNADELVDETGASEVRIAVGAQANGGAFGFAPAAVRVDPGTTVVWEWTGDGGSHNVVAEGGVFESDLASEAGHTFEWTAESGVYRYACTPHKTLGMKGALVVGDAQVSLGGGNGDGGTTTPDETATPTRTPAPTGEPERTFGGWLANTSNFHRVVDLRGRDEVEIRVGARGNGGRYAFAPAVVHVDPGTTVVWRWVDGGGVHRVVDSEGAYESPTMAGEGATYSVRFDGNGVSKYACEHHGDRGMRGVVLVGFGEEERTTPLGFALVAGVGGATILALLKMMADAAPGGGSTATGTE
ncbi:MAG: halocyanin domain-containing protein [Haloferacaceae archaeon]